MDFIPVLVDTSIRNHIWFHTFWRTDLNPNSALIMQTFSSMQHPNDFTYKVSILRKPGRGNFCIFLLIDSHYYTDLALHSYNIIEDQNRCSRRGDIVFIQHILHSCRNLLNRISTMQLLSNSPPTYFFFFFCFPKNSGEAKGFIQVFSHMHTYSLRLPKQPWCVLSFKLFSLLLWLQIIFYPISKGW